MEMIEIISYLFPIHLVVRNCKLDERFSYIRDKTDGISRLNLVSKNFFHLSPYEVLNSLDRYAISIPHYFADPSLNYTKLYFMRWQNNF